MQFRFRFRRTPCWTRFRSKQSNSITCLYWAERTAYPGTTVWLCKVWNDPARETDRRLSATLYRCGTCQETTKPSKPSSKSLLERFRAVRADSLNYPLGEEVVQLLA